MICPACKKETSSQHSTCFNCGHCHDEGLSPETGGVEAVSTVSCPKCGQENNAERTICRSCGAKL